MNSVDPHPRQVCESGQIVVGRQQLCLEPPHLAARRAATFDRLVAHDPAHRGIAPQPLGVVHVLVPGKASVDRLAQETHDAVPAILASPVVGEDISRDCSHTQGVVEFAIGEQSGVRGHP